MLFIPKQVSLLEISSIQQKMKISPKTNNHPFCLQLSKPCLICFYSIDEQPCKKQRTKAPKRKDVGGNKVTLYSFIYTIMKNLKNNALANIFLTILSPPHTVRKELSKLPREAVCSAVSSRVRGNCGEKFASRGREDKIKHV